MKPNKLNMMDNGKMIKKMEKVFLFSKKEVIDMKEILLMMSLYRIVKKKKKKKKNIKIN
jgi:hypothetical protein